MIKRLVSSAAVAGLVIVPAAPVAQAQTRIDEMVKDSLVILSIEYTGWVHMPPGVADPTEAVWSDQTKIYGGCTGFVVDPSGFIATAGHCVDVDSDVKQRIREQFVVDAVNSGKLPEEDAESFLNRANREAWAVEGKDEGAPVDRVVQVIQPSTSGRIIDQLTTAQVVDLQKFDDGDNALLKVSGFPALKPLVIATEAPRPGQELTSIGFPGSVESTVDPSRLPQPSFKSGTASSQQVKPSGASVTEINADVSAGMSGGPTVDNESGEVLGINSYGITGETEAFNFITDAPTLRSFLQKNGVVLAAPAPSKGKSFPWIWVAVGVGVLVLVAIGVILLVSMNKKKSKTPAGAPAMVGAPGGPGDQYPTPGGPSYPTPPPPPPPSGPTYSPPSGPTYAPPSGPTYSAPPSGPAYSPPSGPTYSPPSGPTYPPQGDRGQTPPAGHTYPPPGQTYSTPPPSQAPPSGPTYPPPGSQGPTTPHGQPPGN